MKTHVFPGLDASNPLGFLAALGLLRVVDDVAERTGMARPRLAFVERGAPVASLETDLELDALYALILDDAARQADNPVLQLAYTDKGIVPPNTKDASRDLKPKPEFAKQLLASVAGHRRRVADLAAACFSELVQDNNGNTKPTAFHFTAGQQELLVMAEALRVGVCRDDIEEALQGPWRGDSSLPSLSWDAAATRYYALRARNPSGERRGSVAAANWLGVHGLEYFPVAMRRGALVTTRVEGGWKDSVFTWPIWDTPAAHDTVRGLLRLEPSRWSRDERSARGVIAVLRSSIARSDQGGYGSFSPSGPLPPSSGRGR